MHPVTRRIIDRTPARLRPGVELTIRTIDDSFHDRVPGLAAEIAFFALLSLPPLLLTVLAGIVQVGNLFGRSLRSEAQATILDSAQVILTGEAYDTVQNYVLETFGAGSGPGSIIGLGLLITILSASRVFRVVSTAITIAYDLEATRPAWKHRVWGLVLTLGGIVTASLVGPLLIAGPDFGTTLSRLIGGVPGLPEVYEVVYWPAAAALLTTIIAVLYHVAAPWNTPFRRDLPGALLAMVLWLLGTGGLRVYVSQAIGESYGFIATPLIILLWLYVSAFAVLLGAELNAEIEKMSPTAERTDPEAARHRHEGDAIGSSGSLGETREITRVDRRSTAPSGREDSTEVL